MGRAPCCSKVGLRRGPWTLKEDDLLIHYIQTHGEGHWRSLPKRAGLLRCGKSCRLRWMNYLRPDIKRGNITPDEEDLIIRLHSLLGNRWSLIAGRLPGRTDNELKNYWNSHLSKRIEPGKSRRSSSSYSENKGAKGLGKRRKSNTMNTVKHNNGAEEIMKITKVKAHQPKATRVSLSPTSVLRVESNSSFDNRVAGGIPVSLEAGNEGLSSRTGDASGYVNIPIDSDYDILSSSYPYHNDIDRLLLLGAPSKKAMLEKVSEEYQDLLMAEDHVQLESFLDSLWI